MSSYTTRRAFISNGIITTLAALSIRTVALVFSAYISRLVGSAGIGLFTLVNTVYGFAVTFATSGISLTVTRLVAGENDSRRILRAGLLYASLFSAAASFVLLVFAPSLALRVLDSYEAAVPLRILSLSLFPMAVSAVLGGYFVGKRAVRRNVAVQILSQLIRMAITLICVAALAPRGAYYATVGMALTTTLTEILSTLLSVFAYLVDRRRLAGEGREVKRAFRTVADMALPIAVSAYIRSALVTVEHILIPKRLVRGGSTQQQALSSYGTLHGMALPLLLYPMTPLTSFSSLLVPEFSQAQALGDKARISGITERALSATLGYAFAVFTVVSSFSEELGYAVFGSQEAGFYIGVLSLVVPIMYLDHVTDAILKGIGEQVYSMWVNITDTLLSVILIWFLLPKLGIFGYAVVIIAMESYNFLMSYIRLRRRISFSIDVIRSVALPLVASVISTLLCKRLFANLGAQAQVAELCLKMIFCICVFVGVSTILRLLFSRRAPRFRRHAR